LRPLDAVTLLKLLVARQHVIALAVLPRVMDLRFLQPIRLDPDAIFVAEIGDAALPRGFPHSLGQFLAGPLNEAPAIGQALAAGIEAAVDDVHGVCARPIILPA
jgi:hypothetical protein